ncbi:glycosyltransferase family 39 protein [Flammeovirgaceae bacterium SG7u.111]|nr:glycosyltransferase family 39 protein [Flammeovirgaceae bacterium SG7u.132]WPO33109.1 glycosyltransferase family 39 protein [Flammeovirgaceae bacterium SG7u.111]
MTFLNSIKASIKNREWESLTLILLAGFLFRLIAAFFSKGFAFHDDHFCVITVSQYWEWGVDYWFEKGVPPLHSLVYAGMNYGIFLFTSAIGITDPEARMVVVRLFHAVYSMSLIYFSYKIALVLSENRKTAGIVGWIMVTLWFMPMMSVKNLVEMASIPLFLAGYYLIVKECKKVGKPTLGLWFVAGALFGFAFLIRYHTILFAGGMGLALLWQRKWLESAVFSLGYVVLALSIMGVLDMILYDYPLQTIVTYFEYNSANAYNYVTGPPERYIFTVLGFLVPPVSLMLAVGYFKAWKKSPEIFWGGLVFFVFHSLFPNKQERFILPLLPLIIILGIVGWQEFVVRSKFWQKRQSWIRGSWIFFWTINFIAAMALSLTYSKKARIEPLYQLSKEKNVSTIVVESTVGDHQMSPVYYLGKLSYEIRDFYYRKPYLPEKADLDNKEIDYPLVFPISKNHPLDTVLIELEDMGRIPDYVIFKGRDSLEQRVAKLKQEFPGLEYDREISVSVYDAILHFLNPGVHKDEHITMYKRNASVNK